MAKFKSGDKVRILRNRNAYGDSIGLTDDLKIGDVVMVKEDSYPYSSNHDFDVLHVDRGAQWLRSDDVELVKQEPMTIPEYSCIRVVPPVKPKREIVESYVCFDCGAFLNIKNGRSDDVIVSGPGSYFTATALREAAALFTTLAEVLEENAK